MSSTCSGPNCTRHARAKKDPPLCSAHYYQWRRGDELVDLDRPKQADLSCAFDGCVRTARALGYCKTHYDHVRRYGEAVPIGSMSGKRGHRCHEPGCDALTMRKFCDVHMPTAGQECEALDCPERALGATPYCTTHARTDRTLRHSYGISLRQRDAMLIEQGFCCLICHKAAALHIDHCHETGQVRGMLCGPCNRGIGLLRHDAEVLRSALIYLGGE